MPALESNVITVISDYTAGDPMREDVVWTYLSSSEIAAQLAERGTPIGVDTVRVVLGELGIAQRQAEKTKTMGDAPQRNEQFENIARWKNWFRWSANPIISMDTKKKEFLGNFFRKGKAWSDGRNAVFDHDFSSYALGKIIPHGLYDVRRNIGHITLGTSRDTSQFACDSLRLWWNRHGRRAWPRARSMLLLCDGGGSNNWRHMAFKEDLQRLASDIGLSIQVAHYPPYCSKYNPIEHRLFPHVTRAWSGVIFRTLGIVVDCLKRVWTSTGLKVTTAVLEKTYQLGRQASDAFLANYPILHDDLLPNWNYNVIPWEY